MIIEKEEMEQYKSKYGNRYREISVDDLLSILYGKVLCLNDYEYTTFVYLEQPTGE
jgi:hypothetical protein